MNKTVYGITGVIGNTILLTPDQIPTCDFPEPKYTAAQLKSYTDRANELLAALVFTRSSLDQTLNRLDVIRQELCILTETTYRPLPPPPEVGTSRTENGKISLQTNIS